MTKEEFAEWKASFPTKEFFKIVQDRIENAKDILSVSAGLDSGADRFMAGMIRAFEDVLDVTFEETND